MSTVTLEDNPLHVEGHFPQLDYDAALAALG